MLGHTFLLDLIIALIPGAIFLSTFATAGGAFAIPASINLSVRSCSASFFSFSALLSPDGFWGTTSGIVVS
jgi:hypothetical protein